MAAMLDAVALSDSLTQRYGVHVIGQARKDADGLRGEFRPADVPHTRGFSVTVLVGWRTVEVDFVPATYGRQLLHAMALADKGQRSVFNTFIQAAVNAGAHVTFQINGQNTSTSESDIWPTDWRSLTFGFSKGPMTIDGSNPQVLHALALEWTSRMMGCVLSLMHLEAVEDGDRGEAEGTAHQALITRYERSALNRQACMAFHGRTCKVCGFDFHKVYGPIGEGYIEVHHVESLARLAPGTVLNPVIDLVPLCSNCHSMAHKRSPLPYSVEELKAMILAAAGLATSHSDCP
jgi:5-methylcytosine-specific restriction protein A